MREIAGFISLFLTVFSLNAAHIAHGNMYYDYLGQASNGGFRYRIVMVQVADCLSSNANFDENVTLGIYSYVSDSKYLLKSTFNIKKTSEELIEPQGAKPNKNSLELCIKKAVYETEIILDISSKEYYITHIRCCRSALGNIIDSENVGSLFHVKIPIKSYPTNSSPRNDNEGALFVAKGAKFYGSLQSYDKDGDSLSYKLRNAISVGSLQDPIPTPPQEISLPFSEMKYINGYNGIIPLGAMVAINLDSTSGNISFIPKVQGRYLLAYEVAKWRNGVIIAKYYRERFILVVNLPPSELNKITVSNEIPNIRQRRVNLNWNHNIENLTSKIQLEREVSGTSNWQKISEFDSLELRFTDVTLNFDVYYNYRLSAENNGAPLYSNIVSAIVRDKSIGVNEIQQKQFVVYPNPASDKLFISSTQQYDIKKVVLTDIQGKTITNSLVNSKNLANGLDISQLSQGVYLLKVVTKNGDVEIRKIIKQ